MSKRRIAIFIVVGILIGAGLTAGILFFSVFQKEKARTPAEDAVALAVMAKAAEAPPDDASEEPVFTRDIKGDCELKGTVRALDQKPISDAWVRLWVNDAPWTNPVPPLAAKSNTEGRFRLGGVNAAIPVTLFAFKPGYAVGSFEEVACGVDLEITLEKGASMALAINGSDGSAAEEAWIEIAGSGLWPPRVGHTDAEGRLLLEGLLPGDYSLFATKGTETYLSEVPITLMPGDKRPVAITLAPSVFSVMAIRDTSSRQPIAGATVAISPTTAPLVKQVSVTDAKGMATFIMPKGTMVEAVAGAPGFLYGDTVVITEGDHVSLYMKRGVTLSGVVKGRADEPIAGATIQVVQALGRERVDFEAGTGEIFHRAFRTSAAEGWPRFIALEGAHVIAGPMQVALPLAQPHASADNPGDIAAWAPSDSLGRFVLEGLPLGRISLFAYHTDYVMSYEFTDLILTSNEPVKDVVIRMREGTRATVRVVDYDGFPVPEAEMTAFADDGRLLAEQMSASDGYAIFRGLPNGFRIEANKEGMVPAYARHEEGKLGEEVELRIRLATADKMLTGRVKDARGTSLGGVPIIARARTKGVLHVLTSVTQSDGRFEIRGVGPGTYSVTADAGPKGVAVAINADYEEEVNLLVEPSSAAAASGDLAYTSSLRENEGGYQPLGQDLAQYNLGTTDNLASARLPSSAGGLRAIDGLGTNRGVSATDNPATLDRESPPRQPAQDPDDTDLETPEPEDEPAELEDDSPEPGDEMPEPASEATRTPYGDAENLPVTGPPSGRGGLPISLSGSGGRVIVTQVVPGSRVEAAGLTKGSRLLSVDGKSVKNPADARRAISGTIGTVVMLEVSDRGETYTIVVQRERSR